MSALLPTSTHVHDASEDAHVSALAHGAMAGVDLLHDAAFDCACACAVEGAMTPIDDHAGIADARREWRWLVPAMIGAAAVAIAASAWWPWGVAA